ncbi:DDB1- and CUL4-associated factor 4 [Microbotryomycetes sp. JL201]|nr:DDB1- and CUL4-associated factor 4 [Microbotryomycetes sp. JL201]
MDEDDGHDRTQPPPPPPFNMPGYEWDGKRFYKQGTAPRTSSTKHLAAASRPNTTNKTTRGCPVTRKRSNLHLSGISTPTSPAQLDDWLLSAPASVARQSHRRHHARALALGHLSYTERVEMDGGLPLDEDVTCINLDADLNTIRVGGSLGSIATGFVERPDRAYGWFPNDSHAFRTTFMLSNKITSLTTSQGYVLATSFGSPARALFSSTSADVSLSSIVLSPGKTSIWSAAQAGRSVALGKSSCDRGVLTTKDPTLPHMTTFTTGGKGGGGNVFALDLTDNLVFAGTRKGHVKVFDQRCSTEQGRSGFSRAQATVHVQSPVTHCKRLETGLLIATMNGGLALHDMRSMQTYQPLVTCSGHVNTITLDLGMDVWRDEVVALAGEDGRVRMWSVTTGDQITPPQSTDSANLLKNQFRQPVKAIAFTGSLDVPSGSVRSDDGYHRFIDRSGGDDHDKKSLGPTLWLADGPSIVRYDLPGIS